jgi:hypothetical protein
VALADGGVHVGGGGFGMEDRADSVEKDGTNVTQERAGSQWLVLWPDCGIAATVRSLAGRYKNKCLSRSMPGKESAVSAPTNPRALTAYRFAVYGLIPLAGLFLGPIAVALGVLGLRHCRAHPADKGQGHAGAAVLLGVLEVLTNTVGLTFIWIGLASLRS